MSPAAGENTLNIYDGLLADSEHDGATPDACASNGEGNGEECAQRQGSQRSREGDSG